MITEIKYLQLLSPRLEKFKQKKDFLWNFRCPLCGDSQKNKNKVRGFVFRVKGDLVYKCHNCQISLPLAKLIQELDPGLYKEYKLEKFKENNSVRQKVDMRKVKRIVSTTPIFKESKLSSLTPLDNLNNSHPAKRYILARKLPVEALYYTEKFKEWTNEIKPGTFEDTSNDEPRIIIPFLDKEGNLFGYQGRSLSPTGLRYITVLLEEDHPKVFGLNNVTEDRTVYITEGPFDSLLLSNSVAMAGADINTDCLHLGDDCVYVYDNEPRNHQICERLLKQIHAGQKVVIWPSEIQEKDINDMFLAGHDVQSVVESNTYSGLTAKLKFNQWRK